MDNLIDKKKISAKDLEGNFEEHKTQQLENLLQVLLSTEHDDDITVNLIIAELLNRGISKDEIKEKSKDKKVKDKIEKAFDILGIDKIQKGTLHKTHKYLKIVNGHYIYKENEMTSKDHSEAASHHKMEFEKLNKTNKIDEKHRKKLKYHQDVADRHEKLAKDKIKTEKLSNK